MGIDILPGHLGIVRAPKTISVVGKADTIGAGVW